jgi:hypothetical protein
MACRDARGLVFLIILSAVACGPRADLATAAKLEDVTTGWFDAGVTEDGRNKLVPSVTFRIVNAGQAPLGSTQLNLIFKRVTDTEEWTTAFVRGIGSDGLEPGRSTPPIVVRAPQGYTGTQARLTMLQNSQFVDFKVEVFAKHTSATWVKLGEYSVERQLLTR